MESISLRLKRLRLSNGLSIKEVSHSLGVPLTTYREWENGRKIVGEPYEKLANLYGISIYELITGNAPQRPDLDVIFNTIENELQKLKSYLLSL